MPAIANIVLADAQATPVNHTFVPLGRDANGVWWLEDQSFASPAGYWRISVQLTRVPAPTAGYVASSNRVNRVKIGLHQPTLETLGNNSAGIIPPPTVAYVDRALVEFIFADRDIKQNRKDSRKMIANLLAVADIATIVEDLQDYR